MATTKKKPRNPYALDWRPMRPGPGPGPFIDTSLTTDETDALRWLSQQKQVIEIGTAYGYSAVVMALAGAKVMTVDPHEWLRSYDAAKTNVGAWGVSDRVRLFAADARTLRDVPRLENRFDLAFVDGDHAYEAVKRDAVIVSQLVKPGGTLAFHDYNEVSCPGVTQALDERWPDGPDRLIDTLFIHKQRA